MSSNNCVYCMDCTRIIPLIQLTCTHVIHSDCLKKWILENNLPADILTCPLAVHGNLPNNQDESFDESTFDESIFDEDDELVEQHMRNKYLSAKTTHLNHTFTNLHELINTLITTQNKFNDKIENMVFHHQHQALASQADSEPTSEADSEAASEPDSEQDNAPASETTYAVHQDEQNNKNYIQNMTRLNIIINTMTLIALMPDNEICNLLLLVIVAYITYLNIDWIGQNFQLIEDE